MKKDKEQGSWWPEFCCCENRGHSKQRQQWQVVVLAEIWNDWSVMLYLWNFGDNSSGMFMFKTLTQPQCPFICQSFPTNPKPLLHKELFCLSNLPHQHTHFFPSLSAESRAAWHCHPAWNDDTIKGLISHNWEKLPEKTRGVQGAAPRPGSADVTTFIPEPSLEKREEIPCFSNSQRSMVGTHPDHQNFFSPTPPCFTRQAKIKSE